MNNRSIDKKLAKSFNGRANQTNLPKKIEPLTRNFFSELIKLETDFYNKLYTVETLDEMVQYYAKAVEFYDTTKDEISSYFIFKIQDALATKKSLKILMEKNTQINEAKANILNQSLNMSEGEQKSSSKLSTEDIELKNEVIKENIEEEGSEDEDDVAVKEFAKKRKALFAQKNKEKKAAASFSTMRNQQQRFVNFYHKLENQMSQQGSNMNSLIHNFDDLSQKNDLTIRSSITSQKDKLKAKIEEKKNKSYISRALSNTSYFINNKTISNINDAFEKKSNYENSPLEDVLRDLEEVDVISDQPIIIPEIKSLNSGKGSDSSVVHQRSVPDPFESIPIASKPSPVENQNDSRTSSPIREMLELSPIPSSSEVKPTKQFSYSTGTITARTVLDVKKKTLEDHEKNTSPSSNENDENDYKLKESQDN